MAIAVFDALIARFKGANEPVLRDQVAKALHDGCMAVCCNRTI
jgi:hypothetical protein